MAEKIVFEGTVASKVTERLREDIISKKIEAGSRITIKEISERYGTSNMPVREAFRTLEGEKLLEINAYKGATVLCIDETFVREIYGLLRALECLIYESALPYIDDELIDELKAVNEDRPYRRRSDAEHRLYRPEHEIPRADNVPRRQL